MDKDQPVTGDGEQESVADGEDEAADGPQDITMSGGIALPKLGAGNGE